MKLKKVIFISVVLMLVLSACGVHGDPGYCFFSLDWEYYNDDYRVYFYEDDNPDIPDFEDIEQSLYYECYPGDYEYYYESEDEDNWYSYTGEYTLVQNLGYEGGLFADGLDGVDTYFDLYLLIYAKKGLPNNGGRYLLNKTDVSQQTAMGRSASGRAIMNEAVRIENRSWEETRGEWTISFKEEVRVYNK